MGWVSCQRLRAATGSRFWLSSALVFAAVTVSGTALAAGSTWSVEGIPRPRAHPDTGYIAVLRGVSCVSARFCMALGSYVSTAERGVPLAERWNGRRWSMVPIGPRSGNAGYGPVFCWTRADCIAVGGQTSRGQQPRTVVQRWNGAHWSAAPAFNPAGASQVTLTGLSCPGRHTCFVSGWQSLPGQATQAIVEELNRGRWSLGRCRLPRQRSTAICQVSAAARPAPVQQSATTAHGRIDN